MLHTIQMWWIFHLPSTDIEVRNHQFDVLSEEHLAWMALMLIQDNLVTWPDIEPRTIIEATQLSVQATVTTFIATLSLQTNPNLLF